MSQFSPPPWIRTLRVLIGRLEAAGVAELELAAGKQLVYIRRRQLRETTAPETTRPAAQAAHEQAAAATSLRAPPVVAIAAPSAGLAPPEAGLVPLTSPLTGVYWAAPAPGAPPYVVVGDFVEQDQVVALVEAMKVFNEIHADEAGRVSRIQVKSGQLVRAGEAILLLEPGEAPMARPVG